MSKAIELARHLEEGAFAPNILQNENAVRVQSAAELRRLAQVEAEHASLLKAISDAEPVAWLHRNRGGALTADQKWLSRDNMRPYADACDTPLYTLNGIKKP